MLPRSRRGHPASPAQVKALVAKLDRDLLDLFLTSEQAAVSFNSHLAGQRVFELERKRLDRGGRITRVCAKRSCNQIEVDLLSHTALLTRFATAPRPPFRDP